jgi:hypothetical protein
MDGVAEKELDDEESRFTEEQIIGVLRDREFGNRC